MNIEHELRLLNISPREMEELILAAGGQKVQERLLQRRYTYNTIPAIRDKWMRLRTNGTKTTLAIKQVAGSGVSDTKEIETEVGDFETTAQLITELGIAPKSYQENYRTLYSLDGAEIMVDEWPLIPPYAEIEAPTPEEVIGVIQKLGFDPSVATGLDVSAVFEQIYHIKLDDMPELKFS